jgi:hypothetical protein
MSKEVLPKELMNSVLGKLYDVLANGDGDVVPPSDDNYLAWLSVGVPYPAEELDFLSEGLTGVIKKSENAGPKNNEGEEEKDEEEKSIEEINQLLAQDTARKYQQAENFARIVDMIPDTSGVKGDVTMNVWNPENTLTQAYEHILRFSQVANFEPDEKLEAKIEKLRGLLQEKKIKKDIITDEETEVLEESQLVIKYNEKMQNFLTVALEYNSHRVNALTAKEPGAVHFWAMNAPILRNKVLAAKRDWVNNGYKEEYEKISAFISQVEGRSMLALKERYLDDLDKSKLTGLASGADFLYASLVPGNFAKSDSGWTQFSFSSSDYSSNYSFSKKKGSAGGGLSLGLFRVGGSGGFEKNKSSSKMDASSFYLKFKIAQVPIVRPWFNVNFLTSKYWRFDKANPEFKNQMVSDGELPPNGMIPAYTTTAIFVKDLVLHFGERHAEMQSEMSKAGGGGYVGWGPFHLGGSYSSTSGSRDFQRNSDSQGIKIDGMQLIGFKCHMLPKSPDPNPDVKEWV